MQRNRLQNLFHDEPPHLDLLFANSTIFVFALSVKISLIRRLMPRQHGTTSSWAANIFIWLEICSEICVQNIMCGYLSMTMMNVDTTWVLSMFFCSTYSFYVVLSGWLGGGWCPPKHPENLAPSCKPNLDFWDFFGKEKTNLNRIQTSNFKYLGSFWLVILVTLTVSQSCGGL